MSQTRRQNIGFLGFANVGKTTLFSHLREAFSPHIIIEDDDIRYFNIPGEDGGENIVWDLKQNVTRHSLTIPEVIYQTTLVFIVYDVSNFASLDISYFYRVICMLADVECKLVLVGNKADLKSDRFTPEKAGEMIRDHYKLTDLIEISSKNELGLQQFKDSFDSFFKKPVKNPSENDEQQSSQAVLGSPVSQLRD